MHLAVAAATAMVIVNTVVLVRDGLGRGGDDVAIALGAYGIGSMTAALLLPRILSDSPTARSCSPPRSHSQPA